MNCPFCGANYHETELQCPYCKGENKLEAERRKSLELIKMDEEAENIKNLPKKMVKKSTKYLLIAGAFIAVGILVSLIITFVSSKLSVTSDYQKYKNHLTMLSKYYEEQSYMEMYNYLQEYNLYESNYLKYVEISDAYYNFSELNKNLEELKEENTGNKDMTLLILENCLYYGERTLSIIKDGMNDKAILGNEDILNSFYQRTSEQLKTELKLTSEEIEQLTLKEPDISEELAKKIAERQAYK